MPKRLEVLHYVGADDDRGGIISVVRNLASTGRFDCVLGMNPGSHQHREPPLTALELPRMAGERISPLEFWRARAVARAVQAWLHSDTRRVFHGHSRAGLLVGLWLHWWGERCVVVSVHCYGRQRWFYCWASGKLRERLFWLTPEMWRYYGAPGTGWNQCIAGGVPLDSFAIKPPAPIPGRLRLGGAGMIVRWKRWDIVLEALALLPAEVRAQITFEHIGGASDEPDSRACAAELFLRTERLGLSASVQWRGAEPSSQRLLGAVDLVVVPSHHEPYSMILQEALAAGVPVLAAASGGPLDVVRTGETGWFFPDGDARALADLLESQVRTRAWAALDRAIIGKSACTADKAATQWAEVYAAL